MNIFQKPAQASIGLDIGLYSTKAVQLSNTAHGTNLDAYTKLYTEGLDLESLHSLNTLAKETFQKTILGKFSANSIVLSLPRKLVFETIISVDKSNIKLLSRIINQQLQELYNLNTNNLYIGYSLLGQAQVESSKTKQSYAVVCIPKDWADLIFGVFSDNGFKDITISSEINATKKCCVKQNKPLAILDIGYIDSNYLFTDGKRFVASNIGFSTQKLENAIAQKLNTSQKNANNILYTVGVDKNQSTHEAFGVCKEHFSELVNDISDASRKIDPFIENEKETKLLISGFSASTPGLIEFLENNLNTAVEIVDPWAKTTIYPLKPMPKKRNNQYSNAIGLALMGIS